MKKILLVFAFLSSQFHFRLVHSGFGRIHYHCLKRFYDLSFIDEYHGWAVGYNGTILKTTDGGANWIILNSQTNLSLNSVIFIDQNIGWAVGWEGIILHTTDGGLTWNSESLGSNYNLHKYTVHR